MSPQLYTHHTLSSPPFLLPTQHLPFFHLNYSSIIDHFSKQHRRPWPPATGGVLSTWVVLVGFGGRSSPAYKGSVVNTGEKWWQSNTPNKALQLRSPEFLAHTTRSRVGRAALLHCGELRIAVRIYLNNNIGLLIIFFCYLTLVFDLSCPFVFVFAFVFACLICYGTWDVRDAYEVASLVSLVFSLSVMLLGMHHLHLSCIYLLCHELMEERKEWL